MPQNPIRELPLGPEDLPAVTAQELMEAWDIATLAAIASPKARPTTPGLRFRRPNGDETTILFADFDAGCWAEAIDRAHSLGTTKGVALCLRLLGLVELMATAAWMRPLFSFDAGRTIDIHPALVKAAAGLPLTREARFDGARFRRILAPQLANQKTLPS